MRLRLFLGIVCLYLVIAALVFYRSAEAINVPNTGCMGMGSANTLTVAINNAGASTNLKLVSKVSAKKIYICAINVGPVAAAVNVALVDGTLTTNACDTSTAGLAGGATAATGWQFAANSGLTLGDGNGLVAGPAATNTDVCLFFSAGVQVSGTITYAQF